MSILKPMLSIYKVNQNKKRDQLTESWSQVLAAAKNKRGGEVI
jgi:hypothetical protein